MPRSHTSPFALGRLQQVALSLMLATSQAAWAEANPYYIGVSQSFTHNSNVLRTPSTQSGRGDTISSTGLNAGIDQPFGRQRLRVNGSLDYNQYSEKSNLNNSGYGLNTALDWSTVGRLSGSFNYSNNGKLADYGEPNTPLLTSKNVQKTQEFGARALLGGVTVLSFTGDYSHRTVDYSNPAFTARKFDQDTGSLGIRYRFSGALDVGGAARMTRGVYPNFRPTAGGGFEGDTLKRSDFDLSSNWTPTGLTTVAGRVSMTRVTHSITSGLDFSGLTGSVSVNHTPAGRLRYSAQISRDTGTAISSYTFTDVNGNVVTGVNNNNRLTNSVQVSVGYEVTAKIQADASLHFRQRSLIDTLNQSNGGAATGATGGDTTTGVNVGLSYAPLRNLGLGCRVGYDKRTTTSALSSTYDGKSVGCSARYTLQ